MTNKQVTLYKGTREEFEAKYEDYKPMGKSFKEQLDDIQSIGMVFYFDETMIKDEDGNPPWKSAQNRKGDHRRTNESLICHRIKEFPKLTHLVSCTS